MKKILVLMSAILFIACGKTQKEIGRLPINIVSTKGKEIYKEFSVNLKKGDRISLWSVMDVEYSGKVMFQFEMIVLKDDKPYDRLKIDPMNKSISIGEVKTMFHDKVNWQFTGKNMEIEMMEDGKYTFRSIFIVNTTKNYKVNKAELIIKK